MKKRLLFSLLMFTIISVPVFCQDTGDVNNNSQIDIIDAMLTAQYYVGLEPGVFYPRAGDVNCDSAIGILDAL